MKDLKTLLKTLEVNGTIEFTLEVDYGLETIYKITKYSDKLDGGYCVSEDKKHFSESYNTKSITRGALNLYTFDIFNHIITTKIKIEDMKLLSFKLS